ncbi:hypothetical protein ACHAXT_011545, partial [Thalassiosira profunda]
SSSLGSGEGDEDRALLLPSHGSTFNLTGDAEYLLPKSASHHSANNSRSSRSAGYASGSSRSSGGKGKKTKRSSGQQRQHDYVREQSSSSVGSGSPAKYSVGNVEQLGEEQPRLTFPHPFRAELQKHRWFQSIREKLPPTQQIEERTTETGMVIYSALLAYTLLVTVGPLMLHFRDPQEWCPYYWPEGKTPGFSLGIDQLQQPRQQQQEKSDDDPQQRRRRLTSNGVEILPKDAKRVEMDLLRRTSKDIHNNPSDTDDGLSTKYDNIEYDDHPCRVSRIPVLFYLTLEECDLSRRMAASVLLGGFIGYERRASDRPAGIRTMALVSLGPCFFTISSQLAFRDSPMSWDSSRVTAAIPSGVGFLGAGLIWKGSLNDGSGEVHQVQALPQRRASGSRLQWAPEPGVHCTLCQHILDKGFDYDDEDDDEFEEATEEESVYDIDGKERLPANKGDERNQDPNYEMHQMGLSVNDTTTLNRNVVQYGSTVVEGNTVAQLLEGELRRHMKRMSRLDGGSDRSNEEPPFWAWLTNLLPGKGTQQPYSPYQEVMRDREVMRLMKKKKSMSKMSSRPSFCT